MSSTKLCDKRVLNTCRRRVLSYCKMGGGEIKNPLQFYFCAVTGKKCQPDHRLENAPFCFNKLIFPPFVLPIRRTFFSTLYPPTNELEKTKYNSQLLLKLPDVAAAQFSVVCALHYTTLHYTILHYTARYDAHHPIYLEDIPAQHIRLRHMFVNICSKGKVSPLQAQLWPRGWVEV